MNNSSAMPSKKELNNFAKSILQAGDPDEWSSFLFGIQNSLVHYGYFESLTKKGREDFANKFGELNRIFEDLKSLKATGS